MSEETNEATQEVAKILVEALNRTGVIEVLETQISVNEVHMMARVHRENEKDWVHGAARSLLYAVDDKQIELFIGKQFFLKDGLKFAWVVAFSGPDLIKFADRLVAVIEEHQPEVEIGEQPLLGPKAPQAKGPGSKGVRPVQ